ncbi:MAG: hypothetical protein LAO51_11660 [Acidobacteriia bacterium]|nr:hypothetical protein [Terriglobia bacterium]
MARMNAMLKPGEKASEAGIFYCYVCSLRGETSTCDMREGQMFLACPRCLERKVAEWDLAWKPDRNRPANRGRRIPRLWPGALGKPV